MTVHILISLNVRDASQWTEDGHRKGERMKKRGVKFLNINHFVDF